MKASDKYETTIGLEVHVQLFTKSKIFCGCSTRFGSPPNTQTCPVCLGLPGVLPVLNREAFSFAIKAGLALKCGVAEVMKFDRKNYFYPDLPKNFQISQYDLPLATEGDLDVITDGGKKTVRIRRVHLEEDAGKLMHVEDKASLVDFNRTGIPLLEIVSEPDIASPQEAYDYLVQLKSILRYLEVSDCNMEEGSLRCDANISIRPKGQKPLGVKTELKNMNTFKGVKNALEYEIDRQGQILEEGGAVIQDTRLWDETEAKTYSMRTKEEAFDYRYFPEPDLVPFLMDKELVESIKKTLPELPQDRLRRFISDYKLPLTQASLLVKEKDIADFFEETLKFDYKRPLVTAKWMNSDIQAELNKRFLSIKDLGLKPEALAEMIKLIDDGTITGKIAKGLLQDMIETKKMPRELVESKGLSQIKDKDELAKILDEIIKANPDPVKDYKRGKVTALTFLVGQVMRATKGKANPKLVNELLRKKMEEI